MLTLGQAQEWAVGLEADMEAAQDWNVLPALILVCAAIGGGHRPVAVDSHAWLNPDTGPAEALTAARSRLARLAALAPAAAVLAYEAVTPGHAGPRQLRLLHCVVPGGALITVTRRRGEPAAHIRTYPPGHPHQPISAALSQLGTALLPPPWEAS